MNTIRLNSYDVWFGLADGTTVHEDRREPFGKLPLDVRQRIFPEEIAMFDQMLGQKVQWIAVADEDKVIWRRTEQWDGWVDDVREIRAVAARKLLMQDLAGLQKRAGIWRENKPLPVDGERGWIPPTPTNIVAKLLEEAGEVSTAVIGLAENRPDRGDPIQEAAQVVLVLLSYAAIHHPDRCLFTEVLAEAQRAGA